MTTYRLQDWIALFTGSERALFDLLQKHLKLDDEEAFALVRAFIAVIRDEVSE